MRKQTFKAWFIMMLSVLVLTACGGGGGGGSDDNSGSNTTTTTTYSISGKVADSSGTGISSVTVTLSGSASSSTTTDSGGNYTFSSLSDGSYTITPSKTSYTFSPASKSATVSSADATGQDFTGIGSLVAHYPFNGNANDESGNGNNGTVNGATLTTDRFGNTNKAYSFDGVNDSISVNDSNTLDLTTNLTFSAWIYFTSNPSNTWNVLTKWGPWGSTESRSYAFNLNTDKKMKIWISTDGTHSEGVTVFSSTGKTTLSTNTWHHIAGVYDGSYLKVYVDGSLDGSVAWQGSAFIGNAILSIGVDGWGNNPFNGSIDDIHIYNRALSDTEIQLLYQATN